MLGSNSPMPTRKTPPELRYTPPEVDWMSLGLWGILTVAISFVIYKLVTRKK